MENKRLEALKALLMIIISLALFTVIWMFLTPRTVYSQDSLSRNTSAFAQNRPIKGENTLLEVWLDKLVLFENCPFNGIIDNNGLRSYGPYCYQELTFLDFMARFPECMPFAEKAEWLNNLADYDTQRCLTKKVVLADKNAYRHWYTSTVLRKGLGLPPIN